MIKKMLLTIIFLSFTTSSFALTDTEAVNYIVRKAKDEGKVFGHPLEAIIYTVEVLNANLSTSAKATIKSELDAKIIAEREQSKVAAKQHLIDLGCTEDAKGKIDCQ